MNELRERLEVAEDQNRLNRWVAITVALVSVFMGVTKVKDDNIVQAMLQAKSDSVDRWNEYQSKKLKHHMAELGLSQLQALKVLAPDRGGAQLAAQQKQFLDAIARYQVEEAELMKKAKALEKSYDDLNYRDDQFDLSDACLSICLGMLGVASLTNSAGLLYLSWVFAGFGGLMGFAGLLGLAIHPDLLTKLLS
ncbi:hypothetical protein GMST_09380 [Geomonas silvestris]|uniref:DUF4337 domain-containing protein n=1 Tax=Geomonas silvestris TaxID=2740184 RepID=A0A6V8MFL5_9BACT|nr:DUF4337 domain-containing protein [Geomonas silvestris]GFO58613.1 hypothetical protein GMST_09380 [Geomonas silvestris]